MTMVNISDIYVLLHLKCLFYLASSMCYIAQPLLFCTASTKVHLINFHLFLFVAPLCYCRVPALFNIVSLLFGVIVNKA